MPKTKTNTNDDKHENSFSEKLQLYFKNYPDRCCDVSFLVGNEDQQEVVKTSRIILEIACPEFINVFHEKWGETVGVLDDESASASKIPKISGNSSIQLLNVDPKAFKIFLQMLILDDHDISLNSLKKFHLAREDLLNVAKLCKTYKMWKLQRNLEIIALETLSGFSSFAATEEFLTLSESQLNTILQREDLDLNETEIFNAAIRWAEKQCYERCIESTDANLREVLGDSFYQIRFPTMSLNEFANNGRFRNILTQQEELEIFRFISSSVNSSLDNETISVAFNTRKRVGQLFTTVEFLKGFEITDSPSFVCDGAHHSVALKVNKEVEVLGVGFLGPIDSDSFYKVTVDINTADKSNTGKSCGKVEKQEVFARKAEIFYVYFEKPIKLKATYTSDNMSGKSYTIKFNLNGPNTQISQVVQKSDLMVRWFARKDFRTESHDGIGFFCCFPNTPLAELRLKKC